MRVLVLRFCAALSVAACGASVAVGQPKPPAPAGGAVTGRVTAAEGQRLPEIVIFLEATDPKFTFTPPHQPVVVSQQKAMFRPGLVVVPVGSKVEFRNDEKGPVEHNVFSKSEAKKFDLGLYKPDDPIEPVTFDTPGPVRLRCSIHRYMDGVVYVTPTPYFAVIDAAGKFKIVGVQPGNYRIKSWQRSQRFREIDMPVTVTAGKMVVANITMSR